VDHRVFEPVKTAVDKSVLVEVARTYCKVPDKFSIHPKLEHLLKERLQMVKEGSEAKGIDWGMGEILAYGSLLLEGKPIRLSGQDVCRGTFSHRHALWVDQKNATENYPLNQLRESQARFEVINSPLSEFAVLGFDFGYSVADPKTLVIWEAQFGDFANGAQVVIDQYIATTEEKWGQRSGVVLLLPHGYEGQGPEHSSGRLERFLQLAGDDNIQVVNPTTPAQMFHLLRRQAVRSLKKPLVVFTPKGLLRHPACISKLNELTEGSFQEVLEDLSPPKSTRRLVFCTGRIYYDLIHERSKENVDDMAIIRIEQLYPFNQNKFKEVISKHSNFQECYWVQDEPMNMGAYSYIRPILEELLPKEKKIQFIGRETSAATAVGLYALHKKEHAAMMQALFGKNKQA
jgi:2-oxoglutarate dehydrogenase E1 component